MTITHEKLLELVRYDSDTGKFYWIKKRRGTRGIGKEVGYLQPSGYLITAIDYKYYRLHRLAWFYTYKEWPRAVDHINGDRSDNRIANLRLATDSQSMANRRPYGKFLKGVLKAKNRFAAQAGKDGKAIYLGTFDTEQEAHDAYCRAARELHGKFARTE